MYDIIGDIHGHYDLLVAMLEKLGYQLKGDVYEHPSRKVIFTGDIINRGPKIRRTVQLVRGMVESGNAQCLLGNHELNAILYATMDKSGAYLQKHLPRFQLPLKKTLDEYKKYPEEFAETIKWFRKLPIYLDLGNLRVVHGCWNDAHIELLNQFLVGSDKLTKSFLRTYITNKELNTAVTELIKGVEMQLPKDFLLKDNKGIIRRSFRIKWWGVPEEKTFKKLAFGNQFTLPAYSIPKEILPKTYPYPEDAPPVFLGHYCLNRKKLIYQNNICCVDTCITRCKKLTAYRWDREQQLTEEHLVRI